jgi:NAD(P)-dependent dehydrogenase (short-subunit alcohol dehydrogenase family)
MAGTPASSRSYKEAYDSFDFDRAAREGAAHAMPVAAIAPGVSETPMMAGMPEGLRDALGATVHIPPPPGKPVEFAALAQHIRENVMLDGEAIRLDAALRMAAG